MDHNKVRELVIDAFTRLVPLVGADEFKTVYDAFRPLFEELCGKKTHPMWGTHPPPDADACAGLAREIMLDCGISSLCGGYQVELVDEGKFLVEDDAIQTLWVAIVRAHYCLRQVGRGCGVSLEAQAEMRLYLDSWVATPLIELLKYLMGRGRAPSAYMWR